MFIEEIVAPSSIFVFRYDCISTKNLCHILASVPLSLKQGQEPWQPASGLRRWNASAGSAMVDFPAPASATKEQEVEVGGMRISRSEGCDVTSERTFQLVRPLRFPANIDSLHVKGPWNRQ